MDLFDLVAKITLDSSEYEKAIKGASEGAEGLSSKWALAGKGLKALGVASVAAVGASAAAVGALTKQAVQAYANYEQLAGGVKKLYGDAADELMRYAEQGYKTSGMSANKYMEIATSFSASLINSLGGDQSKAAKQTDVAMRAISDNFNTFGGDISNVQNAFQGFAKQNYTMLDNLKLGYGGTKTEMERLIADANEYAEANGMAADLSIDSFSDIVTAIDLIQQKQGIAGTTAKEAATTIEGSLNMTKAAWENLVTGFADPDADIGKLMDNLVTAIVGENEGEGLLNNITPAIERAMEGIGTLVEQAAPIISEHLPKMIETLLPPLITAVTQLVVGLITALPTIIAILVEQLPTVLETVWDAIDEAGYQLIETGANAIANFAEGMWQKFQGLISSARSWASSVVQSIKDGLGNLFSIGANLIQGLWDGIKSKWEALKNWADETFTGWIQHVKEGIFGEASPSKIFREIGQFLTEGLAIGMEDNIPMVESASDAMYGATAITPSTGNSGLIGTTEGEFGRVAAILQEWLPQMTNMDIILDSGALVGELTYDIDRSMGRRQQGRSRGNAR